MPSPVVRAPPSSVEDAGLILVQGFKIPYTVGCSQKKFFLIEKKIREGLRNSSTIKFLFLC